MTPKINGTMGGPKKINLNFLEEVGEKWAWRSDDNTSTKYGCSSLIPLH
jgi:hypothetical protein